MSMQLWRHYERVTAIADCDNLTQVQPILLNNAGQTVPAVDPPAQPLIQYTNAPNRALIITRVEGYITQFDDGNPAHVPTANYEPFQFTGSGLSSSPLFEWVYELPTAQPVIVMPPQPQSIFDTDVILGFPAEALVSLFMVFGGGIQANTFGFSVRAYGWIIPQAALGNFAQLQTLFGGQP